MLIDAHAHVFSEMHGQIGLGRTRSLQRGKIQTGDGPPQRLLPPLSENTTFPPDVLLEYMDWGGVDRTILLQGSWYGEANDYVANAVRQWPDRFTAAAFLDPRSADARQTFTRAVDDLGYHILKFEMTEGTGLVGLYPDLRLDDDSMAWIWEEAERRDLVVTLDLGAPGTRSYQTDAVRQILDRHPTLTVVIAHLAQPPIAAHDDEALNRLWRQQLALGALPNVVFDLSALPAYLPEDDYPYALARSYVRQAKETVGAESIMWGTDAPALLRLAIYDQLRDWVARHCDFLSASEREAVLGGNAQRVYVDTAS